MAGTTLQNGSTPFYPRCSGCGHHIESDAAHVCPGPDSTPEQINSMVTDGCPVVALEHGELHFTSSFPKEAAL